MQTPKVSDIIGIINKIAPFSLAEEWDNAGLQVGDPAMPVERIMTALDPCREAVKAAIAQDCRMLLTHHPLIFNPVKRISLSEQTGSLIALAVKHDLAVVSMHTNYDIAEGGLNDLLAERLGVGSCAPLKMMDAQELVKLSVFVPSERSEALLEALFPFTAAIGNYSDCSFRSEGVGTFMPLEGAKPFLGRIGERASAAESRVEVLLRKSDITPALAAMRKAHPYEEPAFDLYPLLNRGEARGLGRIGELPDISTLAAFAAQVKERLGAGSVRVVGDPAQRVKKVALCGGSGASLMREARFQGADLLVTGDVKYHEARDAQALGIALIDAGHFSTEILMVEGAADRLRQEMEKRRFKGEVKAFDGEREPFSSI